MNEHQSRPEYGANLSDYHANYDPYVYGKPEEDVPEVHSDDRDAASNNDYLQENDQQFSREAFDHQQWFGQFDPNDPKSNPYYGRWNPLSILSFLFVFTPFPIIAVVLGFISANAAKKLHMRGFVLSVLAVVLGILLVLYAFYQVNHPFEMPFLHNDSPSTTNTNGDGLIQAFGL